jgi:hypothetical protein
MFRVIPNEGMDEWHGDKFTEAEQRLARLSRERHSAADDLMAKYDTLAQQRQAAIHAASTPYDAEMQMIMDKFYEAVADGNALIFDALQSLRNRLEPPTTSRRGSAAQPKRAM